MDVDVDESMDCNSVLSKPSHLQHRLKCLHIHFKGSNVHEDLTAN